MAKKKKIFPNYKPRSKRIYRLRNTDQYEIDQRLQENLEYLKRQHVAKWAREGFKKMHQRFGKSGKTPSAQRFYNTYRNNPEEAQQLLQDSENYSQGLITAKQIKDMETYINERNDLTIDDKKELRDELYKCNTQEDFERLKKNMSAEKGVHPNDFNIDIG